MNHLSSLPTTPDLSAVFRDLRTTTQAAQDAVDNLRHCRATGHRDTFTMIMRRGWYSEVKACVREKRQVLARLAEINAAMADELEQAA